MRPTGSTAVASVITRLAAPVQEITRSAAAMAAGRSAKSATALAASPATPAASRSAFARVRFATVSRAAPARATVATARPLIAPAPIGLDDNFFELGGHSLLALQLLPRIREKYQILLEPREFFANPTVAKLVVLVEDKLLTEIEEMAKQDKSRVAEATASAAE